MILLSTKFVLHNILASSNRRAGKFAQKQNGIDVVTSLTLVQVQFQRILTILFDVSIVATSHTTFNKMNQELTITKISY